MFVAFDYASPSSFESQRERALLGFSSDARRPVKFHAHIKRESLFPFRIALQALGNLIWSDDTWQSTFILDPIITVHPDGVFFEAFSSDQSAYGIVILDRGIFDTSDDVQCGTTNIDFTAWLWAALGEMRSSRDTSLRIGAEGFEIATQNAGGRFEKKVDVPDSWVRGFLQLQSAMAMPGTRVAVRSVDLLAAIRYLQFSKAKVSPRALRYEFEPGKPARLVLEPWEQVVTLKESEHNYTELRVIRTWGRRRLRLIEPLLPYADSVDVYLKGRALPSFYAVKLPGITFVLGLSGWSENQWTSAGSFDLLGSSSEVNPGVLTEALKKMRERFVMSESEVAKELGVSPAIASRVLAKLCRQGRIMHDLARRDYRSRELFEKPLDEAALLPPDPRTERARRMLADNAVQVSTTVPQETRKVRKLKTPDGPVVKEIIYREWRSTGNAGDQSGVEIVVNDSGKVIFGTCGCEFFKENLLNKSPCEHMIALHQAVEALRKDLPSSVDSTPDALPPGFNPNVARAEKEENKSEETGAADDEEAEPSDDDE